MSGRWTHKPRAGTTRPARGVTPLGLLLVFSSLVHMVTLLNYANYTYLFQDLPGWLITVRYALSWLLRLAGVWAGLGLCARRESGRRAVVGLCVFTIATVYWKHPYAGFTRHTASLDAMLEQQVPASLRPEWLQGFTFAPYTAVSTAIACLLDVAFAGAVVWYLTRPHVAREFR